MTNNIQRRILEHKNKILPGFTEKYNIYKLVFVEKFETAMSAIEAEKKLKGWTRRKKIALIVEKNPNFVELKIV